MDELIDRVNEAVAAKAVHVLSCGNCMYCPDCYCHERLRLTNVIDEAKGAMNRRRD